MSGSKKGSRPNNGGARKGTRPIIKRLPDLFDIGVEFSDPYLMDIDGLVLGKCNSCGAIWWGDYRVYVRTVVPLDELTEEHEEAWPVIGKIEVKGQPEKHHRNCPMK